MLRVVNTEKDDPNRCYFKPEVEIGGIVGDKYIGVIEMEDTCHVGGYAEGNIFYIDKFECEDIGVFISWVLEKSFKWAEEKGCNKVVFRVDMEAVRAISETGVIKIESITGENPIKCETEDRKIELTKKRNRKLLATVTENEEK